MTTLDQMDTSTPDPVHLLLIAKSKVGKSTYVAQAAKDGMTVLYLDADNGLSAIRHHLKDNVAAQKRVHYIPTTHPAAFLTAFLSARRYFEWNLTKDEKYSKFTSADTDQILKIDPNQLLQNHRFILAVDSWTSCAADAMEIGAESLHIDMEKADKANQSIYGVAFLKLNRILQIMQPMPFHICVLAHGTYYERYEKPTGVTADNIKQKDMLLKEVLEIPISSSRPHGAELPKYFNHVAWLELDRVGRVKIDFTRSYDRVGGGPPNRVAPVDELSFVKLLGAKNSAEFNSDSPNALGSDVIKTIPASELQVNKQADASADTQASAPANVARPANLTIGGKATGVSRPLLTRSKK